jgi:hypothetical protein
VQQAAPSAQQEAAVAAVVFSAQQAAPSTQQAAPSAQHEPFAAVSAAIGHDAVAAAAVGEVIGHEASSAQHGAFSTQQAMSASHAAVPAVSVAAGAVAAKSMPRNPSASANTNRCIFFMVNLSRIEFES